MNVRGGGLINMQTAGGLLSTDQLAGDQYTHQQLQPTHCTARCCLHHALE